MTFTNQELQIKNIIKTVKNGGLLFVEGNDFFHSFPLTRKETKRILKRKQREIRRKSK
jgi:hypothetical protein